MRDGILIVNKPTGMTSHDVVDFARRKLGMQKIGHAGTLDPLATGVLVLLLGKCTRLFSRFLSFEKEYAATLTLGIKTDSGDVQGTVVERKGFENIGEEKIKKVFSSYIGESMQVPPMYSALKHKGSRLYALARKGKQVERQPRKVMVKELRILRLALPDIQFYLKCSKGTYVRQLAEDIARDLGSVGCVSQIERQGIGPFRIESAISLPQVEESKIQPFTEPSINNRHIG
jgi:tRNA pseudouridine55 synthase